MKQTLKTPDFQSEKEEAEWYDTHEDEILTQFKEAAKDGTLSRGTLARRGQTAATSIRLNTADIEMAKALAEKRGIGYQTYLKMIIHQHLVQEATSGALSPTS
jgi:predicted DNA binding CopG/RHH family protein